MPVSPVVRGEVQGWRQGRRGEGEAVAERAGGRRHRCRTDGHDGHEQNFVLASRDNKDVAGPQRSPHLTPHPRSAGAPVPAVASLGAADKAPFIQGYFVEFLRWSEDRCALPPRVANAWSLIYCIDSGVIGVNGSGKSSLMKIISARRTAASPDIISRAQTHGHRARSHANARIHSSCMHLQVYMLARMHNAETHAHAYMREAEMPRHSRAESATAGSQRRQRTPCTQRDGVLS